MSKKQAKPNSFQTRRPDEETIEFYVNGTLVGSATHDSVGWDGMDAVDSLFSSIASALGGTVEEAEEEEQS